MTSVLTISQIFFSVHSKHIFGNYSGKDFVYFSNKILGKFLYTRKNVLVAITWMLVRPHLTLFSGYFNQIFWLFLQNIWLNRNFGCFNSTFLHSHQNEKIVFSARTVWGIKKNVYEKNCSSEKGLIISFRLLLLIDKTRCLIS